MAEHEDQANNEKVKVGWSVFGCPATFTFKWHLRGRTYNSSEVYSTKATTGVAGGRIQQSGRTHSRAKPVRDLAGAFEVYRMLQTKNDDPTKCTLLFVARRRNDFLFDFRNHVIGPLMFDESSFATSRVNTTYDDEYVFALEDPPGHFKCTK